VTISDAVGTTIYYTTNGTTPTSSSSVYGGAITVSASGTLEAIAVESGYTTSAPATAAYAINPVLPAPTFSPAPGTYTTPQSVTISDAVGTTIYYTTNGTTPTTSSSVYGGAITVSASETLEAIAVESGYTTSAPATAAFAINPVLPAPTFSPAPGTYTTSQSVTISATSGTTIYYTTNGTTPTTSSYVYGGAITVSASETLEAIAVKSGYTTSAAATAAYTISPVLPAPTFSPAPGTYTASQSVTISDTVGTTIYYTTNGTTPTMSSSVYAGPITVSNSKTVNAIAAETGFTTSAVGSAAYTISSSSGGTPAVSTSCYQGSSSSSLTIGPLNTTGASVIAIVVASFNDISSVTDNMGNGSATGLTAASGGSPNNQLFYWQTPNVGSGHSITVNGSGGLYASACVFVMSGITGNYSGAQSAHSAGYSSASCQPGSITPASGPEVVITGFGVYTPTGIPTLDSSYTVGAYQGGSGGLAFGEAAGYLLQPSGTATNPKWNWGNNASTPSCVIAAFGGGTGVPTAATPTFSPVAGTYAVAQAVTIGDATPGVTVYYTTNGTTPTTSSSVYGGAITVSASETLEAIAVESGYTTSAPAKAVYTINPVLPAPTFSPAAGTYTASQSVTISDTVGTTIYYTTNGTTPTTSSNVYGGAITVSASETLEAIAAENGYTTSAPATAAYTISPVLPAPAFLPVGGTYTTSQQVAINATAGATIYYTTNGTTPTTSSSVYAGPITVSSTETLNAIATQTGYAASPTATAAYIINPVLPAPSFSPGGGFYASSQSVSIGDSTAGTTIYYTTNGTTPTTSSSAYGGAITVSASETLEAIAVKNGYTSSAVASAAYAIRSSGGGTPAVSTSCYQGSGSGRLTMGPLNTTGASAIAIVVASFNDISSVADNMGNGSATGLTAASGGSPNNQIFYWQTPNVGSGHTITVNGSGGLYASACVFVMSGINGVYSGAQSAHSASYSSASCQAGSITPASGPEIVITGFGVYTPTGIPTLDSSYTVGAYQAGTGGSAYGEAVGYIIQSSGAATNPKWNWGNDASTPSCVIAAFGAGTVAP
jgi:hypothetical protein